MAATIEDVALKAGVSVATVSRALRGLPNVAPATRDRVMAVARELHYVADPAAARLASGRNLVVGYVVPRMSQWYYATLFGAVEEVVGSAGYDVLPFTMAGPGGVARFIDELPFRKRVDGIIVADAPLDEAQLDRVVQARVPMVTIGVRSTSATSLVVDNEAAARMAVRHLTGFGHRRIALIGGADDDPFRFSVPVERRAGYLGALASAGLQPHPELAVAGNFSFDGGAEAMQRLLALDDPPTAVFACSDEMAIGAMQVARDAGLDVPGDLSIIGFDDHDVARFVGLTTIRQDLETLGTHSARLLLDQINQPSAEPVHERLPTRLVVRRTTGPPPSGSTFRW